MSLLVVFVVLLFDEDVLFFVDFVVVAALVVVVVLVLALSNVGALHLLHGVYLADADSSVVSIQLLLRHEQPEL